MHGKIFFCQFTCKRCNLFRIYSKMDDSFTLYVFISLYSTKRLSLLDPHYRPVFFFSNFENCLITFVKEKKEKLFLDWG